MRRSMLILPILAALAIPTARGLADDEGRLRAGAAAVDVSPTRLPATVNGGFLEAKADKVNDPLHARALVLDDGKTRLAIAVVDSCMMPRELIDRAKELARDRAGIPIDRMLVSATHTHSAPAAMGALGSGPDDDYVATLPARIAEAIAKAAENLRPARVGWAAIDDAEHTHCRRWIRRPDKMIADPFGSLTVRAHMHPGYLNPDVIGPSGPVDPQLSVLAVRSPEGEPIALLANYSMHYFGASPVSADYYGRFADRVARLIDAGPGFVAIMSQGTSGDQHWMDYGRAQVKIDIDSYAEAVARKAVEAYGTIRYRDEAPLAMAETTLTLRRRAPDEARMAWAWPIVREMGDRPPKNLPEVYAREAAFLHDEPERTLKLQAIRIGELGIAAIPDEVFGLTGLKIKARSPLPSTFTIELANGAEGYIPTPEQHRLGGYTTWPARTAALEVEAEPKIVEAALTLLERVSGEPRRREAEPIGPYARAVLDAKPVAYWRLGEMEGLQAADATGRGHVGDFEGGVALHLDGVPPPPGGSDDSRAVHLAGGHLGARLLDVPGPYSVEFWFWNGLPNEARPVAGYLFDRGGGVALLGLGGTDGAKGRLFFTRNEAEDGPLTGRTEIAPKTWNHVVLVLADRVTAYLNGEEEPEFSGQVRGNLGTDHSERFAFGDRRGLRGGDPASLEGKLDEVAVYDRALSAAEAAAHYRAATSGPGARR